ncbi:hypothetical protein PISMIDRAFT_13003 [Pisolithus microcarpus 441]|uniref:Uncharacterized protein n=1 Tax=Pisolithus microcarpus 441 TaxID=765257 RepID=A0A0C9ZD85_9AGAM|nr:hypothetical protein PISMIDRAFT_13003 [Pisolithus microcarpus 441]
MSRSLLTNPPVENENSRADQAVSPSESGMSVCSGDLSARVASDSPKFASVPETPIVNSTMNPPSPVQPIISSDAVLPRGTPSAIGALRLCRSAVYQPYSTPFRNLSINPVSPKTTYMSTEGADGEGDDIDLEREEANFVLEAACAQRNVCILEQQLAAAKVEETVALGNLYWFRAQEAERKLEDANIDVGRIRHDIRKSGVALHNSCKRRRASSAESTLAVHSTSPNA